MTPENHRKSGTMYGQYENLNHIMHGCTAKKALHNKNKRDHENEREQTKK